MRIVSWSREIAWKRRPHPEDAEEDREEEDEDDDDDFISDALDCMIPLFACADGCPK